MIINAEKNGVHWSQNFDKRITNLGSFFQKVYGPIIYKFEGIKRNGQKNSLFKRENYYSYITGVEYVETRILDKIWDLSFFIEYSNDEKEEIIKRYTQLKLLIGENLCKYFFNNEIGNPRLLLYETL